MMTYMKNVTTLTYDESLCTGCTMCLNVCPHAVFVMENKKAKIEKKDDCMECGACMINCPVGALNVKKGVGCAAAIISSKLQGRDDISCGCSGDDSDTGSCCC